LYAYVGNSPIGSVDRMGTDAKPVANINQWPILSPYKYSVKQQINIWLDDMWQNIIHVVRPPIAAGPIYYSNNSNYIPSDTYAWQTWAAAWVFVWWKGNAVKETVESLKKWIKSLLKRIKEH
jgi:hypothetical protein